MKIAFVVPRYGTEIRGGAETGARMLAEHLAADRGHEVEVLTTCALDAITWRDELPEGTEIVRGVTVHRIRSEAGRDESFHPLWAGMREDPARASREDMERWVDLQGPRSPALLDAVAASDADVLAFYPYLYYPTVRGLPLVAERAVLHPAAHEEPALHLPIYDELFARCRGLRVPQPQRAHAGQRALRGGDHPQVLVGLGVEEPPRAARTRGRSAPPTASATRPTSCASAGWTTRRGPACCGASSAPTRGAIPARSAWCSSARWSTLPRRPTTSS